MSVVKIIETMTYRNLIRLIYTAHIPNGWIVTPVRIIGCQIMFVNVDGRTVDQMDPATLNLGIFIEE